MKKYGATNMTDQETAIREMFDSNPDLTLEQLSRITRLSIKELKKILMSEEK